MKYLSTAIAIVLAALSADAEDYDFNKESKVLFLKAGEETLHLDYWQPEVRSGERTPAVVMIHGGAWMAGTRKQLFWYGKHFAENGYFATSVEYRMLPDHGFPKCLYDVKEAVRWVRRNADRFNVDPDRIVVMGSSAGGHLASLVANTTPEDGLEGPGDDGTPTHVSAAVLIYPAVDLRPYEGMADRKGFYFGRKVAEMLEDFVTQDQGDVENPWERASPITYVHENTPPTIIFSGTGDDLVPIEHIRAYFDALAEAKRPARLVEFEGQQHGFDHIRWGKRRQLFEDILIFLEQHLAE